MAWTYAGEYSDDILYKTKGPIASVVITITTSTGSAATLYTDATKATPLGGNTVTTDADGNLAFFADPATYTCTDTSGGSFPAVVGVNPLELGANYATSTALSAETTRAETAEALALPKAGGTLAGPLVTEAPNIVFDGDSITYGVGAIPVNRFPNSNDYPSQVVGSLSAAGTYYNVGVSGETTATMITNAPTAVDTKLASGAANVVCFHGGTNDIYYGANDTTTYGRIVTYCQARRTAGWKVIVGTITPRSDSGVPGSQDTYRLSVNSQIRANWATFADGLADIGNDPDMGTLGQETNTVYYNGDNVHHNPNGYRVLAGYFLRALAKLGITGHQHGEIRVTQPDMWIPAASFAAYSGSPTFGNGVVSVSATWSLHHGATDAICVPVMLPTNWAAYGIQVMWTNTEQASGSAYMRVDCLPVQPSVNLLTGNVAGGGQALASPTAFRPVLTTFTNSSTSPVINGDVNSAGITARNVIQIGILRLGTSGSDTLTGDVVAVLGMYLSETPASPAME